MSADSPWIRCPDCGGKGKIVNRRVCTACGGSGNQDNRAAWSGPCPRCHGRGGKGGDELCATCGGAGVTAPPDDRQPV